MDMIRQMDMSYSYKPVLIKAVMTYADDKGRIKLEDIVNYFRTYYEGRRAAGVKVEKANSIFAKGGYTDKEAERNILSNPFKRFEDMQMLRHTKTLGIVQVDESVWKNLSKEEKTEIEKICDAMTPSVPACTQRLTCFIVTPALPQHMWAHLTFPTPQFPAASSGM